MTRDEIKGKGLYPLKEKISVIYRIQSDFHEKWPF